MPIVVRNAQGEVLPPPCLRSRRPVPRLEAVALCGCLLAASIILILSREVKSNNDNNNGNIASSVSHGHLPLLAARGAFALTCLLCLRKTLTDNGLRLDTFYFVRYSQIRTSPLNVDFSGIHRVATFTVQSWLCITIFFTVAAIVSFCSAAGFPLDINERAFTVAFEVLFCISMLVTFIVTYVLIPGHVLKGGDPADNPMFAFHPIILHNCNLLFLLTELCLANHTIDANDYPYGLVYIGWYAAFAQYFMYKHGVCFYPFVDPTLPPFLSFFFLSTFALVVFAVFKIGAAATSQPMTLRRAAVLYMCALSISCFRSNSGWMRFIQRLGRQSHRANK